MSEARVRTKDLINTLSCEFYIDTAQAGIILSCEHGARHRTASL